MNSTDNNSAMGADLLYEPGADVFAAAGPVMLAQGWSVFPQERSGGRYPSKVNGKSFQWGVLQDRLPSEQEMSDFCRDARQSNVAVTMGKASGKVVAVDIDCMDGAVCDTIRSLALDMLGSTPFVRIGRAPKVALFYRYESLSPRNTVLKFEDHADCMVEVKGHGSLMTLYGLHHVTGRYFHWPDMNPLSASAADAPQVTVAQVEAFLNAVRAAYKVASTASASSAARGSDFNAEVDAEGLFVPVTDMDEKLEDGREDYLKGLTWNLVWRNQGAVRAEVDAGQGEAMEIRLTDLAQKCFGGMCRMDGRWTEHYLRTQAASKIAGAVQKLMDGKMKPYAAAKPRKEPEVTAAGVEQVARMAAAAGRKVIRLVDGEMSDTVDAVELSLIEGNSGVYQRGGSLVRMGHSPIATSSGIVRVRAIVSIGEHSLGEVMGKHATFLRKDSRKEGEGVAVVEPPTSVVKTLMGRTGFWTLPVLAAAITAPTLRADGSLLSAEGHDPATGLLLESGGVQWSIPAAPTREQALAALGVLKDVVKTFPFVGPTDLSVCMSMFLTASVRRCLPAAPIHAVSARAAGSGKTKLADIASIIASGRPASVVAMGHSDEETEKRVGAVLLTGDAVLALDNIERPISGEFLGQVITQPFVRARILGKSEMPELPTGVLVTATGNNLRVAEDLTRRVLLCMLDANCERPELRAFDVDPVKVVAKDRKKYVEACLTVLRGFVHAGSPKGNVEALGSFENWCELVRNALIWLGEADPNVSMETVRASDPVRERTVAVLAQWLDVLGDKRVSAKDAIAAASERPMGADFKNADFREALLQVAGEGGAVNSRALGVWLGRTEGKTLSGMKLVKGKLASGIQQWTVTRLEAAVKEAGAHGLVKPSFMSKK